MAPTMQMQPPTVDDVCSAVWKKDNAKSLDDFVNKVVRLFDDSLLVTRDLFVESLIVPVWEFVEVSIEDQDDGLPWLVGSGETVDGEEWDEVQPPFLYEPEFERQLVDLIVRAYGGDAQAAVVTLSLYDRYCKRDELMLDCFVALHMGEMLAAKLDVAAIRAWYEREALVPTVSDDRGQLTLFG